MSVKITIKASRKRIYNQGENGHEMQKHKKMHTWRPRETDTETEIDSTLFPLYVTKTSVDKGGNKHNYS